MSNNTEKPDYEIAREELAAYVRTLGLPAASVAKTSDGTQDDDGWKHRVWRISFGSHASLKYKTGLGIKGMPDANEVLACYARDYITALDAGRFEYWADEFGYDKDSIKAKSIYEACLKEGDELAKLRLTLAQMRKLNDFSCRL